MCETHEIFPLKTFSVYGNLHSKITHSASGALTKFNIYKQFFYKRVCGSVVERTYARQA